MQLNAASVLVLLGLVAGAAANSGYGKSCNSISFYNQRTGLKLISGNCLKKDRSYELDVSVNSGSCFANKNGVIVGQLNGGYQASCKNFGMSGTVLHAHCKNDAGTYVYSSIDTNNWIGNDNGEIKCFGQDGL